MTRRITAPDAQFRNWRPEQFQPAAHEGRMGICCARRDFHTLPCAAASRWRNGFPFSPSQQAQPSPAAPFCVEKGPEIGRTFGPGDFIGHESCGGAPSRGEAAPLALSESPDHAAGRTAASGRAREICYRAFLRDLEGQISA